MKLRTSHWITLISLAVAVAIALLAGGLERVAAAVNPDPPALQKNAGILDLDLRVLVAGKPLYLILVEKDKQRLRVLKHDGRLRVLAEYVSATGANLGPKVVEGDSKTPEGIYFINKIYTDNKISVFGSRAFHLDYPNVFDEESGRSGNGIFIHGTNKELRLNSSNGCITLKNADLDELAGFLNIETTPVIVVASLEELGQGKNLDFIDSGFEMAKAMLIPNELDRRRVTFDSLYFLNFRGQTVAVGEFQAAKDGAPAQRGLSRSYLAYTEKKGWAVKKQVWHPLSNGAAPSSPLAGATPNVTIAPATVGVTAFADHWAKLWQWPEVEAYAGIFERYLDAQAKMTLAEPTPAAPKIGAGLNGWRLLALALLSLGVSLGSAWGLMQGKTKKVPMAERREGLDELFHERGRQINAFQAEIGGLSYELNLLQDRLQNDERGPNAARLQELEALLAGKERKLTALAAEHGAQREREAQHAAREGELAQLRAELRAAEEKLSQEQRQALALVAAGEETIAKLQERLAQGESETAARGANDESAARLVELETLLAAKEKELARTNAELTAQQERDEAEAQRRAAFEREQQQLLVEQQTELELLRHELGDSQEALRRQEEVAARLLEVEALLAAKNVAHAKLEGALALRQEEDAAEAKRRAAFEAGQQKLLTTQQAELELLRRDREEAQHALRQHGQTVTRVLEVEELLVAKDEELTKLGEAVARRQAEAAAAEAARRQEEERAALFRQEQEELLLAKDSELARWQETAAAAEQALRQQGEMATALRRELESRLAELEAEKATRPAAEVVAGQVAMLANLETELARLRDQEKEAARQESLHEATALRLQELEAQLAAQDGELAKLVASQKEELELLWQEQEVLQRQASQNAQAAARAQELEERLAEERKLLTELRGEREEAKLKAEEWTAMNEERRIIQEEVDALQEQLREERKKLRLAEEKNIRIPELLQLLENMKLEVESLIAENRTLQETQPPAAAPADARVAEELAAVTLRLAELEEQLAEKEGEISQLLVKNSAMRAKAVMAGGIAGADSAAEELGRLRQELANARESKLTDQDHAGQTEELERLLAGKNEELAALAQQLAMAGQAAGSGEEAAALQAELTVERQARLAAEAASARVPELESLLAAREAELDQLTAPQPVSAAAAHEKIVAELAESRAELAAERKQRQEAAAEQERRLRELEQLLAGRDAQLAPPPPPAEGLAALQAEVATLREKMAKQEEELRNMRSFPDEGAVMVKGSHYIPGAVLRAWTKS